MAHPRHHRYSRVCPVGSLATWGALMTSKRIMSDDEVRETLAWALRVKNAPDAKSLESLLASALVDASRDLLHERSLRKPTKN